MLYGLNEKGRVSNHLASRDRLDECFGAAIDMDQGIVLNTEFILRCFNEANIPHASEIRLALNQILSSATKNAQSLREIRNLFQ